jgi:hypothetical protein
MTIKAGGNLAVGLGFKGDVARNPGRNNGRHNRSANHPLRSAQR